jgi:hypothetical protein
MTDKGTRSDHSSPPTESWVHVALIVGAAAVLLFLSFLLFKFLGGVS